MSSRVARSWTAAAMCSLALGHMRRRRMWPLMHRVERRGGSECVVPCVGRQRATRWSGPLALPSLLTQHCRELFECLTVSLSRVGSEISLWQAGVLHGHPSPTLPLLL